MKQLNQYNITGQSYTSTSQMLDASGKVVSLNRYHADGNAGLHLYARRQRHRDQHGL